MAASSQLVTALVSCGVSTVITYGMLFFLARKMKATAGGSQQELVSRVEEADRQIAERLASLENVASRAQLDAVIEQIAELDGALQGEKNALKEIEAKLETCQKEVETKEASQQDIKSSKEEDEAKLAALLASFADISNESMLLEQNLANSMKHVDRLLDELELTEGQRAMLQALSEALLAAGSRLRDLITEYDGVNQRLKALTEQHKDLEEEYTKLVEQQLGG